jgi:hypothetical protein
LWLHSLHDQTIPLAITGVLSKEGEAAIGPVAELEPGRICRAGVGHGDLHGLVEVGGDLVSLLGGGGSGLDDLLRKFSIASRRAEKRLNPTRK